MYKKICVFLTILVLCAVPVRADGPSASVSVSATEVPVDQTSGAFRFTIALDSPTPYAGGEFGVFCSQDVQITSVTAGGGSVTGPKEANGLVWFGFFDGEDSFQGTTEVTVEGTCPIGTDGALVIQDVSIYTIGQQEYVSTDIECGTMVNLRCQAVELPQATEEPGETGMDETGIDALPIICFSVIAAGLVCVLIYKTKENKMTQKENKHGTEE